VETNALEMMEEDHQTVALVKWIADTFAANTALVEASARLLATLLGPSEEEAMMVAEGTIMDEQACVAMLGNMETVDMKISQVVAMLRNLAELCKLPNNAKAMVAQGTPEKLLLDHLASQAQCSWWPT
jgi:hypothetical protein